MKYRILPILSVAGAFALGFAAPASAAIVDFTYTGTLSYGFAETNDGYENLSGEASLTFAVNTAAGYGYSLSDPPYEWVNYEYGGSDYGNTSPIVSATLKAGGQTYTNSASEDGEPDVESGQGYNTVYAYGYQDIALGNGFSYLYTQAYVSNYNGSPSFGTTNLAGPLNYTVQPGDASYAQFESEIYNYDNNTYSYEIAQFTPTSVAISGVPEPATWAMMIIGFAGVGFAGMRMRRREPAAA